MSGIGADLLEDLLQARGPATARAGSPVIIIITTMFMVLSSWQSHCESSPGSFDECRMAPSGRRPKTKPDDLGCESTCTGCQKLHPPSPFIITQPESWYSFYRPNGWVPRSRSLCNLCEVVWCWLHLLLTSHSVKSLILSIPERWNCFIPSLWSMLNEAWVSTRYRYSAPEFHWPKPITSCYDGFQC